MGGGITPPTLSTRPTLEGLKRCQESNHDLHETNLLTLLLLLIPLGLELEGPGGRWRGAIGWRSSAEADPAKGGWRLVRELSSFGSLGDFGALVTFRSITEWRGGGRGAFGSPRGRIGKYWRPVWSRWNTIPLKIWLYIHPCAPPLPHACFKKV